MPLATALTTAALFGATKVANYVTGNTGRTILSTEETTLGGAISSEPRRLKGGEIIYNNTHRRLIGASDYWESSHTSDLSVDDVYVERPTQSSGNIDWDTAYSKVACCDGLFTFEIELLSVDDHPGNFWDLHVGFMPRWTIYKDGEIIMNSCVGSLDGEGNEYLSSAECDGYGYMQQYGHKAAEGQGTNSLEYGSGWSLFDKVKGVANFYTGEIEFFLNGVSQGVAFTDIGVSPMVYAVSSVSKSKIQLLSATCDGEDIGPPVCNVPEWCQLQRGDGVCHAATNNEGCGYDDGDCCEETCVGEKCGQQWGYDCRNPLYNPYAKTCAENSQIFGDGLCHDAANNKECGYDGGDCCEETCVGDNCGAWGYTCRDPSVIG